MAARLSHCVIVALLALGVATPALAAALAEPIAILPFKKASRDRSFPWLDVVITETMGHDLRDSGVRVLPWAEVRPVLMARPRSKRQIESVEAALEVGRELEVGSVIIGSYGNDGSRGILLMARLVDVASGKVLKEKSVDGESDRLLQLQDALLTGLLGTRYKTPKRPKPSGDAQAKTQKAYSLYALSVTGTDEANQHNLLSKALENDPSFPYALRDLAVLEKRAAKRAALVGRGNSAIDADLRTRFERPEMKRNDLHESVMAYFGLLEHTGHHRAIVPLCDRVVALRWSEPVAETLRSDAIYWKRRAFEELKLRQEAIDTGDRYMKEYPRGRFFHVIQRATKKLHKELEPDAKAQEKLQKELARLELRAIRLQHRRCQVLERHYLYMRAIQACDAFVKRYGAHADEQVHNDVLSARWSIASANKELGRLDEARRIGETLIADEPAWARQRRLEQQMRYWPQD